jgi:hypothetical protein
MRAQRGGSARFAMSTRSRWAVEEGRSREEGSSEEGCSLEKNGSERHIRRVPKILRNSHDQGELHVQWSGLTVRSPFTAGNDVSIARFVTQ